MRTRVLPSSRPRLLELSGFVIVEHAPTGQRWNKPRSGAALRGIGSKLRHAAPNRTSTCGLDGVAVDAWSSWHSVWDRPVSDQSGNHFAVTARRWVAGNELRVWKGAGGRGRRNVALAFGRVREYART